MGSIPEGFHSVTPFIVVKRGGDALVHYEQALGAEIVSRLDIPSTGMVAHACMKIGNSMLFLCDENEQMRAPIDGNGSRFFLYVNDVDTAHQTALAAGMAELSAPEDMFWGDRTAVVKCPFGNTWTFAQHIRDVSPEEIGDAVKQITG